MNGLQRFVLFAVAVAVVAGCSRPGRIAGTLVLAPEDTGDVRRLPVLVFEDQSPDSVRLALVLTDSSSDRRRAEFTIDSLGPGDYYLLAWGDLNSTDSIEDGDLVGVHGAEFSRTGLGVPVTVARGELALAGELTVRVLKEPVGSATGQRDSSRTATGFQFGFNHRLLLSSLTVTFPGHGPYPDPMAPGWKDADSLYRSDGWQFGGAEMPAGEHRLRFAGTMDGRQFDVELRCDVQ